jgi:dephospho-CoA kinase
MSTAPMTPERRTLKIGLTGGVGSGKSTLAGLLVAEGAGLIDSDAIAHELTAAGGAAIAAIRDEFGEEYIDAGGALDRVKMGARVFSDARWRRRLEQLLHPMIQRRSDQRASELAPTVAYLVFDVPLLAEAEQQAGRYDRILVIDCPTELQIARALARSQRTRGQIESIIAGQASRARRLSIADDVVFNALTLPALQARALRLHASYVQLASTPGSV